MRQEVTTRSFMATALATGRAIRFFECLHRPALLVEADHPIPQRLPIHAADLCGFLPLRHRRAPLQLPTTDAPALYSSRFAERHRSYSPSVVRWRRAGVWGKIHA